MPTPAATLAAGMHKELSPAKKSALFWAALQIPAQIQTQTYPRYSSLETHFDLKSVKRACKVDRPGF